MPSHTFTRTGYWQDSINSNVDAAAAAKRDRETAERHARNICETSRENARWTKLLYAAFGIGLAAPINEWGRLASQPGDRLKTEHDMTEANWEDQGTGTPTKEKRPDPLGTRPWRFYGPV